MRQKNERLAPEQSRDGPGVMSVFTGRPAAKHQWQPSAVQQGPGSKLNTCNNINGSFHFLLRLGKKGRGTKLDWFL